MIVFEGKNATIYRWLLKFKNLRLSPNIFISKYSKIVNGTHIDDGTCINGKIIIKGRANCYIGKYCAIGDGVRIITSNHKPESLILQYALVKRLGWEAETDEKGAVRIGHNVWIGDSVIILPGVTISNNAIIAAGSVVSKDVPEFAVVAGVPAKVVKYRLTEKEQEAVKDLDWWNWTEEEMKSKHEILNPKSHSTNKIKS